MLIGDPKTFALESFISEAFDAPNQRALGYFLIHLAGTAYGVREDDASLLACSFNEVQSRIKQRGTHQMRCLSDQRASLIAESFVDAIYEGNRRRSYFGLSLPEFIGELTTSNVQWAPDGDAAFDDGSHVLHFDFDDRVRLIAFRNAEDIADTKRTAASVWVSSDEFYGILNRWRQAFLNEWAAHPSRLNPEP